MANLLVLDRSEQLLEMLTLLFKMNGHQVATAQDITATFKRLKEFSPDLILLDAQFRYEQEKELYREIKRAYPAIPIILMSADADLLQEYGADATIEKPFDIAELNHTINKLLVVKNTQTAG